MADDINSPRVRQILAIHADQAADAKAELLAEQMIARMAEHQRDELYKLVTSAASEMLNESFYKRGWELHKLARGLVADPGPCPVQHAWAAKSSDRCPVCDEDLNDGLPF